MPPFLDNEAVINTINKGQIAVYDTPFDIDGVAIVRPCYGSFSNTVGFIISTDGTVNEELSEFPGSECQEIRAGLGLD